VKCLWPAVSFEEASIQMLCHQALNTKTVPVSPRSWKGWMCTDRQKPMSIQFSLFCIWIYVMCTTHSMNMTNSEKWVVAMDHDADLHNGCNPSSSRASSRDPLGCAKHPSLWVVMGYICHYLSKPSVNAHVFVYVTMCVLSCAAGWSTGCASLWAAASGLWASACRSFPYWSCWAPTFTLSALQSDKRRFSTWNLRRRLLLPACAGGVEDRRPKRRRGERH